jgi:hypothetical protein
MYQFNNLTSNVPNIQTFNGNGGAWESWTKPNDAMLIHILCIGGGGGGGGGYKGNVLATKNGGAGGGSGAVTSMYIPAFLIPDTLYVQVGVGGVGGLGATASLSNGGGGTSGSISYVSLYPNTTLIGNLLLIANGAGGGQGGNNSTSSGGSGGAATSVGSTSPFYLGIGQFISTAGQAGGSFSGTASSITISGITCGGAAGGGADASTRTGVPLAAGNINSPSTLIPYITTLLGGTINGTGAALAGKDGYAVKKPLMFVGGSGGGATVNSTCGNGGNGSIASGGGGGGGAGFQNGGNGGNGGNGIVIITSYSI